MFVERCKHLASRLNHINFMLYGGTHPELQDAACTLIDVAAALQSRDADIAHLQALLQQDHAQIETLRGQLGVPAEPAETLPARLGNAIALCREHRLMAERQTDWR